MPTNQQRRDKLKRRAPSIQTVAHLQKIIASFPVEEQQAALDDCVPLLNIPGFVPDQISIKQSD